MVERGSQGQAGDDFSKLIERIPYLRSHGLVVERVGDAGVEVRMPFAESVENLFGSMHAGALFSLAETAAGVAAYRLGAGNASVLLRRAEVSYLKAVKQAARATATLAEPEASEAMRRFASEGRAEARVEVSVEGLDGETLFSGTFEYAVRGAR